MTKKDATNTQAPVDQYRKQIGKQDWKKAKKEVKAQKRAADQQSEFGIVEILLTVTALVTLLGCVYGFLYWYFNDPLLQDAEKNKLV